MSATDQEIVEQVLAGEQHLFSGLVERYQGPIVNYVYRMLGNYDDAVDLSQDIFLKSYAALESYRPRFPFSAWLYRIARNAAIDELRRRRFSTVSLDEPVSTEEGEVTREIDSGEPGPESTFLETEFRGRIEDAVARLPEKYREPLVLRHAGDLSYEEIAEALELPLGTVKTRIFRAREALRSTLVGVIEPAHEDRAPREASR